MKFPRLRTLSRVAVFVLLFQTGLDLGTDLFGSVAFCAIDAESSSSDGPLESESPHVDDCFCCSPCVNVTPIAQPITVTLVAARPEPPVGRRLPLLSRFLFHPPQLLS